MYVPAPLVAPNEVFINTMSRLSIGDQMRDINSANPASTAWVTANQARYVPFRILTPALVLKLMVYNGATGSNSTDVGIFTAAGVKLVSSGLTAMSGINGWQVFDTTDTWLTPGLYYFGLLNNGTGGTYFAYPSLPAGQMAGVTSQAVGAALLPTTATFGVLDAAVVPIIGASLRVLI